METTSTYALLIKQALAFYGGRKGLVPGEETVCVFDDTTQNYMLVFLTWENGVRDSHTMIHIRIKDGKVVFVRDTTDLEIDRELLEAGVPFADIILHEEAPNASSIFET
jgi:hypothetical protein